MIAELRQLATYSLSLIFARQMGPNQIIHYKLSSAAIIAGHFEGKTPTEVVKEHVLREEGVTDVVFLEPRNDGRDNKTEDVTDIVLAGRKDILKSLRKVKSERLLLAYDVYDKTYKSRYLYPVLRKVNTLMHKLDDMAGRVRNFFKPYVFGDTMGVYFKRGTYYFNLPLFTVPEDKEIRLSPAVTFSVAFEDGDEVEAVNSLRHDLAVLESNGLILGHLQMPAMTVLADVTGSPKTTFVIYCMVHIDTYKVRELLGENGDKNARIETTLKEDFALTTPTFEGSVAYLNGINPSSKYEIIEVDLDQGRTEKNLEIYRQNYEETREFVNEIAVKSKESMKALIVRGKDSAPAQTIVNPDGDSPRVTQMHVVATIVDKDGKEHSLGDLYRKNE